MHSHWAKHWTIFTRTPVVESRTPCLHVLHRATGCVCFRKPKLRYAYVVCLLYSTNPNVSNRSESTKIWQSIWIHLCALLTVSNKSMLTGFQALQTLIIHQSFRGNQRLSPPFYTHTHTVYPPCWFWYRGLASTWPTCWPHKPSTWDRSKDQGPTPQHEWRLRPESTIPIHCVIYCPRILNCNTYIYKMNSMFGI